MAQSARSPIQMNNRFIDFLSQLSQFLISYPAIKRPILDNSMNILRYIWVNLKIHLIDSWNNEQMILWKTQVYFNKKILINTSKDINRLGMSGKGESFNCLLQFLFLQIFSNFHVSSIILAKLIIFCSWILTFRN